ncbi:hypothetical protein GJV26_11890 [Massilia dura]|uniref:Uncharacterized protein n=1 Tax=Pseudoduganella dura TaxID=321982 RepID=A0A6I3XA76_9BURK|nr:hypothetical protein [Pseudoduganella dura]MUI13157.1 hypothetical protein [Pseudoduganella dura]GGY07798.1 hypothetical protein GCM10007386_42890 [Pseudoduganella dura]
MNRLYLQVAALLIGTAAITFIATEWRWEPASAGNYLVIVGPGLAPGAVEGPPADDAGWGR